MKGLILTGFILLAIAGILFFLIFNSSFDGLFGVNFLIGVLSGLGLGQLIGGIVGYVSKGSSVKEAQRKKQLAQLQKEKQELEKQAASIIDTTDDHHPSI